MSEQTGGDGTGKKTARLARVPVAFVAGAAALAVTLFQLHDRIWPPVTVQGGEVVAADLVGVGVTYRTYVNQRRRLFPHPQEAIAAAGIDENLPGAVVEVVLRMQGLRGRHCRVRYTVYRAPLTAVIGPTDALSKCSVHVQNGDEGGWAAWVPLPTPAPDAAGRPVTKHYFVRFDLLDEHGQLLGPGHTTKVFGWNGVQVRP